MTPTVHVLFPVGSGLLPHPERREDFQRTVVEYAEAVRRAGGPYLLEGAPSPARRPPNFSVSTPSTLRNG